MNNQSINRRDFLKLAGATAVTATAALSGCTPSKDGQQGGALNPGSTLTGPIPTDKMTMRVNPNTNDKVSILGYGCMRWPQKADPNDPTGKKQILDQEQVNRLVDFAFEHGVNYFDTAPVYCQGMSERVTGNALKRLPREKFYVATKMSNFSYASAKDATPESIFQNSVAMYHNSFKELQVDYIDYYLLHSIGGGGDKSLEELDRRFFSSGLLDFLVEEKKKGKIRNLGFSFHGDVRVYDYMMQLHDEGKYHWDFVQIQMNYLDWHHAVSTNARNVNAEYLYNELHKRGIPAIIMEPLLGGRLSKVPMHVVSRLKERKPENSVASWAFRFCGTYEGVLTVLSGMTYMEHLEDNLRSYSPLEPLTQEDLEYLDGTSAIIASYPTIPCNDCKYCMPCPYGIDIPAILLHYNKCVNEGSVPESTQDPNYRKLRQAYLIGYDRSVPKLRQADHCIQCNECSPHCPQQIRIPYQLQRISVFVEKLKQNKL